MMTESTKQLFDAIIEEDIDKVRTALAQSDVDINYQQPGTGSTALHLCLGKSKIVNELMLHKPKPNLGIFDKEGNTPLHVATKFGYAEAFFHLLQHGANINAKKDKGSPTPLDVALQDDFITTTLYYLLFCCAALTSSAQEKLEKETLESHETMLQGLDAGKIIFEGKTVQARAAVYFTKLDIYVDNQSTIPIDFFCRRIESEYQEFEKFTPKIPLSSRSKKNNLDIIDNDELKSDIFQVKLDRSGLFNISLPIYEILSGQDIQYSELIIKTSHKTSGDDLLQEITGATYSDGKVTVRNIELGLEGQSPLIAVAVFLRTKIDQRTLDANRSETMASNAETKFRISTTDKTFNQKTDVALQVLKPKDIVDDRTGGEEVLGKSDVYSALSAETPAEDLITIELPKPKVIARVQTTYATVTMTCSQSENGEKADSWSSVEDNITETPDGVKLTRSGFGHYIVLAVKSLRSVGRKLKKVASNLYTSALGNKVWCSLLAMTQRLNESATRTFTILCVLCRYDQTEEIIHQYQEENYEIQSCGKSKYINLETKKTYMLTFELFNAKLMTRVQQLPLQYQAQHANFQKVNVMVTGRTQSPHGNVFLLKKRLPEKRIKELAFGEHLAVFVPVVFDVGNLSEIKGEFLEDRLLRKVAEKLGDDWFEVLVRLGMPVMELKGLDMTNHKETNFLKLQQWREKNSIRADRGLCLLLCSLTSAARLDIRKMIVKYLNDYVQSLYTSHPEGYDEVDAGPSFKGWLNNKVNRERERIEISVNPLLEDTAMSPFEDRFLFFVSSFIVGEDIIVKNMGLKDSKYNDMKCINPPSRRMCQMLAVLKAGHSEDPPCSFVRQLIDAIKDTGNMLAVMEMEQKIKEWLESRDPNYSAIELEKIKKKLKIH